MIYFFNILLLQVSRTAWYTKLFIKPTMGCWSPASHKMYLSGRVRLLFQSTRQSLLNHVQYKHTSTTLSIKSFLLTKNVFQDKQLTNCWKQTTCIKSKMLRQNMFKIAKQKNTIYLIFYKHTMLWALMSSKCNQHLNVDSWLHIKLTNACTIQWHDLKIPTQLQSSNQVSLFYFNFLCPFALIVCL